MMFQGGMSGMSGMSGMGMMGGMNGMNGMMGGMNGMMGMGGSQRGRGPGGGLQQQIAQGIQDGSLSKSEAKSLINREQSMHEMMKNYMSDGQLSLEEKMKMQEYMQQTGNLVNEFRSS